MAANNNNNFDLFSNNENNRDPRRNPFSRNNNTYWNRSNSNYHQATRRGQDFCGFCKNNREASQVYLSHRLKDDQNRVTCPQLRRYICPLCGATGDDAHTRSKCPNVVALREQSDRSQPNSGGSPQPSAGNDSGSSTPSTSATTSSSENDLVLGANRGFFSMGKVTNSRYNSAGRLRNRPVLNMRAIQSCLRNFQPVAQSDLPNASRPSSAQIFTGDQQQQQRQQ